MSLKDSLDHTTSIIVLEMGMKYCRRCGADEHGEDRRLLSRPPFYFGVPKMLALTFGCVDYLELSIKNVMPGARVKSFYRGATAAPQNTRLHGLSCIHISTLWEILTIEAATLELIIVYLSFCGLSLSLLGNA